MPEIAPKEKRAKSSLTAFRAFFGKPCCRQTKYNSTRPKTRSKCEGQAMLPTRCSLPQSPDREWSSAALGRCHPYLGGRNASGIERSTSLSQRNPRSREVDRKRTRLNSSHLGI